jgi:hypothetical protein
VEEKSMTIFLSRFVIEAHAERLVTAFYFVLQAAFLPSLQWLCYPDPNAEDERSSLPAQKEPNAQKIYI